MVNATTAKTSPVAPTRIKPTECCPICSKTVAGNVKSIECSGCKSWIHPRCDNEVSLGAFKGLSDYPCQAIFYLCPSCRRPHGLVRILERQKGDTPAKNTCSTETQTSKLQTSDKGIETEASETSKSSSEIPPSKILRDAKRKGVKTANKRITPDPPTLTREDPNPPTDKDGFIEVKRKQHHHKQIIPQGNTHDKAVGTPTPRKKVRTNSLMVFNAPESSSSSLQTREEHDRQLWDKISNALMADIPSPIVLQRLAGKPNGNAPRPLRVEMKEAAQAERALLLAANLQINTLPNIAVRPDLPREDRLVKPTRVELQSRQIIIRGVPETVDVTNHHKHDCEQWHYILSKLEIVGVIAHSVARLPRPTHLQSLNQPRLLRVTLGCASMVSEILDHWRDVKKVLPSGIIIHACRDREARKAARLDTGVPPTVPSVTLDILPSGIPANSQAINQPHTEPASPTGHCTSRAEDPKNGNEPTH